MKGRDLGKGLRMKADLGFSVGCWVRCRCRYTRYVEHRLPPISSLSTWISSSGCRMPSEFL